MAEAVNFELIQGDTFKIIVTLKDSVGAIVPLTDYQVNSTVRDDFGGKIICATCSIGDGIEVDEENGKITLTYIPSKTTKFAVPRSALQLQIVSPLGEKRTLIHSYIRVQKGAISG